jgi:uncharacterized protein with PQ loop repeat
VPLLSYGAGTQNHFSGRENMGFWELVGWLAWSASFVNIFAMALQLKTLVKTHKTEGVSLGMMSTFVYVQTVFCLVGFHTKQWALFVGMLGNVVITLSIVALVVRLRRRQS